MVRQEWIAARGGEGLIPYEDFLAAKAVSAPVRGYAGPLTLNPGLKPRARDIADFRYVDLVSDGRIKSEPPKCSNTTAALTTRAEVTERMAENQPTTSTCRVPSCSGEPNKRGFCATHSKKTTIQERFWRLTDRRSDVECWRWIGALDKDGYGSIRPGSAFSPIRAHRFSYQMHKGPIPEGLIVRHRCNNPACVNPNHLEIGDHFDNMRDRVEAGNYQRGERHHNAKFSDEIVRQVKKASGTNRELALKFGMSESQVSNIRNGRQRNGEDLGRAAFDAEPQEQIA